MLPLTAAAGLSWKGFRQMLTNDYARLTVFTIAAADNDDLSFSADTGLAECLVIARKVNAGELSGKRAVFSSLTHRPQGFADANALVATIVDSDDIRRIEDGPYGGSPLMTGEQLAGEMITAPCAPDGGVWGAVRVFDYALAQTAYALSESVLLLPGSDVALELQVAQLGAIGKLGLLGRDITGPAPRGPFSK